MVLTWNLDQKQMTERKYTRTKLSNNYILTGNYDHMLFSSQVLTDLDTMKVVFGGCNIAQYIKISHVKKKTVILLKVERQCKNIKHGLIIITSKLRIHFHWKIDAVTRKNVEIIESYKSIFFMYSFFPFMIICVSGIRF